jgi:outer membrane receptor protein involved in Fe transport
VNFSDTLKLTVGARYSNDKKRLRDRQYLFNTLVPLGTVDSRPLLGTRVDADAGTRGSRRSASRGSTRTRSPGVPCSTGKPDVSFTDDTLIYASYTRGLQARRHQPPFDASLFSAPSVYLPEKINAFEVGHQEPVPGRRLPGEPDGLLL